MLHCCVAYKFSIAATVGVVGVRKPPKIQVGGVRQNHKKFKAEHQTSHKRAVGISHFQAAVKCTNRCVKSHKLHLNSPQNLLRLGLRPRPHWVSLRRSPDPLVGGGRGHPFDAFESCSWTFVTIGRSDGHPQFLKRGCALVSIVPVLLYYSVGLLGRFMALLFFGL